MAHHIQIPIARRNANNNKIEAYTKNCEKKQENIASFFRGFILRSITKSPAFPLLFVDIVPVLPY